jgi:hypothetical protein
VSGTVVMTGNMRLFGRLRPMRKMLILTGCVGAYLVWPYVALYQIGNALRQGDVQALTTDVAWDSVREGLKEDIADQIIATPGSKALAAMDKLPPFGSGFMTSMAEKMVDQTVTPQHLAESVTAIQMSGSKGSRAELNSAWFTGPTRLEASFRLPCEKPNMPPVRVQIELVSSGWGLQWRVTRAWIPTTVLKQLQTSVS